MSVTGVNGQDSVDYYIGEGLFAESANFDVINQVAFSNIATGQALPSEDSPIMILFMNGKDSVEQLHRKMEKEKTNGVAINILTSSKEDENIFGEDSCKLRRIQLAKRQKIEGNQEAIRLLKNEDVVAIEDVDGSRKMNTKPWSLTGSLSNFFGWLLSDFRTLP